LSIDDVPAVRRELQAIAPLPPDKLERLQQEVAWVDQWHADEQMKRLSYLSILADKYGVQSLRQVMTARDPQEHHQRSQAGRRRRRRGEDLGAR
jgi:hypothetical protein